MNAPSHQTEPQIQFLHQLVREVYASDLQLPRFQRPFPWTDEQCLDLFRSIRAGTPIGSIIVWRTNLLDVRCYDRLGPHPLHPPRGELRTYVIDGQQRLATLFCALHSQLWKPFVAAPDDTELPDPIAYFDSETDDFLFAPKSETPKPTWLPLRFVLDYASFLRLQRSLMGRPDAELWARRMDGVLGAFTQYKIPVLPIVTNDLDQVTKIFQRIHGQGTVMNDVHMVAALTWSGTFDLNERIAICKEQRLAPLGWGKLDDSVILYACKAALGLHGVDADVDTVSRALREKPEALEEATHAIAGAARFFRNHCGIRAPDVVPYPSHIVALAEAIRQKPEREKGLDQDALLRWFWLLTYSGTSAGVPKLLQALTCLSETSTEAPAIPIALASPLPVLPKRFDFRSARGKTLALRLAARAPDGPDLLARARDDALPHLVLDWAALSPQWDQSPANRIFVDPQTAPETRSTLEEACKAGAARSPVQQAVLDRHVVPPEGADAFARKDFDLFFHLRLQALNALESEFARRVGILREPA